MDKPIIEINNIKKRYRMGQIGGGTLTADLQSWWARVRKKEDPNAPLFQDSRLIGKSFMALNGVSFTVNKGEAVAIIGGNGAGKSTLLKILSRVTAPTKGDAVLRGRVASMLEVGTGFNGEMTGRENIYMNGTILGMSKKEIDAKMDEIIEFSECAEFIDTPVKRYSSGMYVKLAFSVAAHLDSEIMIMDEVLAVGDVKFQKKCLGKMGDSANQEGKTILYVSHNMATIRQLCTRAIVLKEGKVIFDGDVEDGIAIYSEESCELCTHKEFKIEENSEFSKVVFKSILLDNCGDELDPIDDKMKIRVTLFSKSEDSNLSVRIVFRFLDDCPCGMVISPTFDLHKGFTTVILNVNKATLINERYALDFMISKCYNGTFENFDVRRKALVTELHNNKYQRNIKWHKSSWGDNLIITDMEINHDI